MISLGVFLLFVATIHNFLFSLIFHFLTIDLQKRTGNKYSMFIIHFYFMDQSVNHNSVEIRDYIIFRIIFKYFPILRFQEDAHQLDGRGVSL